LLTEFTIQKKIDGELGAVCRYLHCFVFSCRPLISSSLLPVDVAAVGGVLGAHIHGGGGVAHRGGGVADGRSGVRLLDSRGGVADRGGGIGLLDGRGGVADRGGGVRVLEGRQVLVAQVAYVGGHAGEQGEGNEEFLQVG